MVQHFPNPIHIGAHASLAYALITYGICSVAAFLILINLLTAFFLAHHAAFFSVPHVELVWLYMIAFATLLFTRPGNVSIDARFRR